MNPYLLRCSKCGHEEFCRPSQLLQRMQQAGLLRRLANPDPALVQELLPSAFAKFRCEKCDAIGLVGEETVDDEEAWEESRACDKCREPIPRERLDLFPDATRCARCEENAVSDPGEELEYCPRCGSPMQLKLSTRPGVTRYAMACPDCRR